MQHPGLSIVESSDGLQLDTSLQHLEGDGAEEDQKHSNKEISGALNTAISSGS
jgi:hypothetical protein